MIGPESLKDQISFSFQIDQATKLINSIKQGVANF
jgi:hypothetical protein